MHHIKLPSPERYIAHRFWLVAFSLGGYWNFIFPCHALSRGDAARFTDWAFQRAITCLTMRQEISFQVMSIAPAAFSIIYYQFCITSFRDLPTIRLLSLLVFGWVYGIDTLFPTTGTAKRGKNAALVPVIGIVDSFVVPVMGTELFRLPEDFFCFCKGGFRRSVGGNLQSAQQPCL